MAYDDVYRGQVQLLIKLLPIIAQEEVFALKGGTAINLFARDMPRLSVDIDLTYLPLGSYEDAVRGIDAALQRVAERVKAGVPRSQVNVQRAREGHAERIHVAADRVGVKIEVTPVLRGVVYEPVMMAVSAEVEETYGFAEALVVSAADLYAGKLIAALDRQHPRDLFDVQVLFAEDGVSGELRRAFIAYLLSSAKPLNSILSPPRRDLAQKYEREFEGMTAQSVSLESLLATREELVSRMVGEMPDQHRRFLVAFKLGEPDWSLLRLPKVAELPAVKFRQEKLSEMSVDSRETQIKKLVGVLFPAQS
jgi:predicted nucleotidyltransferase component of viral defense system